MVVPGTSGRRIEVVDYDPAWPVLFGELGPTLRAALVAGALGAVSLRIGHIGSAAVAGPDAKTVIDVKISVAAFEPIEAFKDPLEQLGYVYRADNPERTKRYFREAPGIIGPPRRSARPAGRHRPRCPGRAPRAPGRGPCSSAARARPRGHRSSR